MKKITVNQLKVGDIFFLDDELCLTLDIQNVRTDTGRRRVTFFRPRSMRSHCFLFERNMWARIVEE